MPGPGGRRVPGVPRPVSAPAVPSHVRPPFEVGNGDEAAEGRAATVETVVAVRAMPGDPRTPPILEATGDNVGGSASGNPAGGESAKARGDESPRTAGDEPAKAAADESAKTAADAPGGVTGDDPSDWVGDIREGAAGNDPGTAAAGEAGGGAAAADGPAEDPEGAPTEGSAAVRAELGAAGTARDRAAGGLTDTVAPPASCLRMSGRPIGVRRRPGGAGMVPAPTWVGGTWVGPWPWGRSRPGR